MKFNNLLQEFLTCSQLQYNGQLDVNVTEEYQWSFYYRLGRIVWARGGIHPVRCWYRKLTQYSPQIKANKIQLSQANLAKNCWDYRVLMTLYKRQELQRIQMNTIVESTIAELLFDVIQKASFFPLSYHRHQETILDAPLAFSSTNFSLQRMQKEWQEWCDAGLANLSPNLAPVLRQPEQLQRQVSERVYQNFVALMTGKETLRDIAVRMKQDLLQLTGSLLPYIGRGVVELVQVPDLPEPFIQSKNLSIVAPTVESRPLIACVDDCPQSCQMLKQILTNNRLGFMDIQDSTQALPLLIERKPDLIFLDLMMPIANGYEICTQIRRVSMFQQIPVIILTGSDGFIDRVRAKVAGASDFLTKPIESQKVIAMVSKYLAAPSPVMARGTDYPNQNPKVEKINCYPIIEF